MSPSTLFQYATRLLIRESPRTAGSGQGNIACTLKPHKIITKPPHATDMQISMRPSPVGWVLPLDVLTKPYGYLIFFKENEPIGIPNSKTCPHEAHGEIPHTFSLPPTPQGNIVYVTLVCFHKIGGLYGWISIGPQIAGVLLSCARMHSAWGAP